MITGPPPAPSATDTAAARDTPRRVGIVDIGTNSTRLLIADVYPDGRVAERARDAQVTRLGANLERTGALDLEAMGRVHAVLERYATSMDRDGVQVRAGVLTSAVRDASNGAEFADAVRSRHRIDAEVIAGNTEAALTFLGAMSERAAEDDTTTLVIDVGGGSTELIVGRRNSVEFCVSLKAGVVRQSERHLHDDPPLPQQLEALRKDVRELIGGEVPLDVRRRPAAAVAVAGTATSCAAIDLALEPYDPARVHGYRLTRERLAGMLDDLSTRTLAERMAVVGLHADRAPTIVAGVAILVEVLDAFGLAAVEVSEHDILRGAALRRAGVL